MFHAMLTEIEPRTIKSHFLYAKEVLTKHQRREKSFNTLLQENWLANIWGEIDVFDLSAYAISFYQSQVDEELSMCYWKGW
jgi:hypothetical protein